MMNVYDFDGTIYKKDSSVELYKYIAKKNPSIVSLCLPRQLCAILKYKLKFISKEQMKEVYFSFLNCITESTIDAFVESEMANINEWYIKQHLDNDVIISASPKFLIEKFAERLGVKYVIASEVNIKTGKFLSKNCHAGEKVNRFQKMFPNEKIDVFYSDSLTDLPMARMAEKAYIIKNSKLKRWEI